ncbi:MAG: GHKL domain-containing protein [Candidatus Sericytochromatia bacterium]|nr:GHKL domain-containing protein [Candidatus Sericytochromatia bacterium]
MELKNRELEQFTYIASHDLQEPLRKIKNFSEMLMEHCQTQFDARSLKYMKYIIDGTERMQALLQNLLIYSRSMRNAPQQRLNLEEPLQQALEDLELRIQESQAEIQIQRPLPVVMANPTQMCQLFQNLISNALKFCAGPPQIQVEWQQEADHWLFVVRDNGIGMAAEDTQAIFDAFHRLHNKNEYPGTGIGLAICQKIILQHNGKIWAESTLGKGSAFFFCLPILKEE